jgi:hypothetical protein
MATTVVELERARCRARSAPFPEVVVLLRAILGAKVVSLIAGLSGTGHLCRWADGRTMPSLDRQERLRAALHAALVVADADGPSAAADWFLIGQARLGGRSPAAVLSEEPIHRARRDVLERALAYAAERRHAEPV